MSVVSIEPGESINAPRGSVVVCIEPDRAGDAPEACRRSVLAHTPAEVPVVISDRAAAVAAAAPADVVVLSRRTVVAAGWLDGLRQAAHVDSTVATASALTSDDTAGLELGLDAAAQRVRERSLRLRPRLRAPSDGCVYLRRAAIELVGPPEDMNSFSERCARAGLSHVLADDVLVQASGPTAAAETGPAARALSSARRALKGMSITVDARILSRPMTGTETHVLELIAALARTEQVRLRVIVPDRPSDDAARPLNALSSVELVRYGQAHERADLVHRPYQLSNAGDLAFLASLGDRLIVTNQDLIGYYNPSYFRDTSAWLGYRHLTQLALAVADHVVFFSTHARDEALDADIVDPARASVVHIGVNHPLTGKRREPVAPSGVPKLPDSADAILCIGTDYRHKNRLFALRLLDELHQRHGWAGYLVFAGPAVAHGSSRPDEAELLAHTPRLAEFVIDVGAVSAAEKEWLLERSRLVVYPTIREGFGLVPFEAADRGVPCLWAPGTSLSEVLPDEEALIVPWDPPQSAARAFELLSDRDTGERQVNRIRDAAKALTWDATAERLLELYECVCDGPAVPKGALEHSIANGALSEDAMRLVGPGGALAPEFHRPLLALATHPRLGYPVFGMLRAGYRASYRLRRWGRRHNRR